MEPRPPGPTAGLSACSDTENRSRRRSSRRSGRRLSSVKDRGWARRYTSMFLDSCRGIGAGAAETAVLLVSELVTNAVRFAGGPRRAPRYSKRANASVISLSLRYFPGSLLIEVFDTDDNPPVLSGRDDDAESGRGLLLVNALSKEWSYFFPPGGGKVVYCVLEIA